MENETPKPQDQILVLISGKFATVVKFNGFNFTDDGLDVDEVTHWLYLPEIPISKRELLREG